MTIADLAVRDRALDIRHSVAVSAPAGSGKTGLLTRRILRLLAHCQAPEQILAITFTRKAAAEMRDRVLAALALARQPAAESDYERAIQDDARAALARDEAEGWALVDNPSRLRIMTIDSLNRVLARQLVAQTGLGALPEPAEQPDPLYRTAIARLFAELDNPGPLSDDLALLLGHLDNNLANLENLLALLLAQREQWLGPLLQSRDARETLEATLRDVVNDYLAALYQALAPVTGELVALADYAAANLARHDPDHDLAGLVGITGLPDTGADSATIRRWQTLVQLLVTTAGGWRKPGGLNKKLGFPTAKDAVHPELAGDAKDRLGALLQWCNDQPGLLALIEDLQHLPATAYSDSQWQLLGALTRLLPRLVAELTLVFNEQQACDFTQITLAAHTALGSDDEPTDLALALDYRLQHILVDEFQDTSSIQFSLLRKLVAGWQPGDGRTLFIVGDGMQSLYGFRNANVGLFLEARHQPLGQIRLQPLDLCTNFRSAPAIVDWVNRTFATVFPPHEDISRGAVPYAPAQAAKPGDPASGVTFDVFAADSLPEDEARQVAARIQDARAGDPEGSIAVLCRARSHLPAILEALRAAGIPWQATDIDPLASRMPVTDLLSLTRALHNPGDRIAWLAVLRAPWCGLDLNDLHTLANSADPGDPEAPPVYPWLPARVWSPAVLAQLSRDGQQRLARVTPVLRNAWDNRQRKPLRQWIEGTWLALGGPATLLDSNEMAWCRQYFELLDQHDSAGAIADMAAFEDAVDRLYAAADSSGDNPVQVMTIHKSKGLEFDTVILPGLHRRGNSAGSALLHWRQRIDESGHEQLLIAPPLSPAEQAEGSDDSLLVRHLKHEARLKDRLEDARVLYVACTRAIKRLHLLFRDSGKPPAGGSLLACLWPALADGYDSTGADVRHHQPDVIGEPADTAESGADLGELLRLAPGWRHPVVIDSPPASAPPATPAPPAKSQQARRQLGTVLHRTLRQIVLEGRDNWDQARLARQREAWRLQLAAGGVDADAPLLATLARAVQTVLDDATGRWLLDHRHPGSACELALCHPDDNDLPTVSVIDRLFVDGDTLWVIDYKSSAPETGESETTFITRESENYRVQLERYRLAVIGRHTGPVKTALYFPLLPRLVELD